jgi:hypothetical protein
LPLSPEIQAVFARIRTYSWTLNVFGQSQSKAWRLVKARTERRINRAGLAIQNINVYRTYVHELVRAFRTEPGEPLVRAIEFVIRKWANLGLATELLQELLGDCFLRFEQQGYAMPRMKPLTHGKRRGPKPGRLRRRSYEKALKKGRIALRRANTVEEQSARHREGAVRATMIAGKLRPVLAAKGIPGSRFVVYFAFAQKLGRLSRTYSEKSLRMAAADLIDLHEAKSLDGDTLRAIAVALFGVNVSP